MESLEALAAGLPPGHLRTGSGGGGMRRGGSQERLHRRSLEQRAQRRVHTRPHCEVFSIHLYTESTLVLHCEALLQCDSSDFAVWPCNCIGGLFPKGSYGFEGRRRLSRISRHRVHVRFHDAADGVFSSATCGESGACSS